MHTPGGAARSWRDGFRAKREWEEIGGWRTQAERIEFGHGQIPGLVFLFVPVDLPLAGKQGFARHAGEESGFALCPGGAQLSGYEHQLPMADAFAEIVFILHRIGVDDTGVNSFVDFRVSDWNYFFRVRGRARCFVKAIYAVPRGLLSEAIDHRQGARRIGELRSTR